MLLCNTMAEGKRMRGRNYKWNAALALWFLSSNLFLSYSPFSCLNFPSRPGSDTWYLQNLLVSFFQRKDEPASFITDEQIICSVSAENWCTFFNISKVRVFSEHSFVLHDNRLWIRTDDEIQCVPGKHIQCAAWIQHKLLWFRLTSDINLGFQECLGMCSGGKWARNSKLCCYTRNTTTTN